MTALAQQEMAALESTPKRMDFDRTYIQEEIKAHQAVLDLADQAHEAAGNAELRTMIEQARPAARDALEAGPGDRGEAGRHRLTGVTRASRGPRDG